MQPFLSYPLFIFNKVFKPKMLSQFTLMCSHFQIKFIPFALFALKFSSFNYCAFHTDEKTFLKIPFAVLIFIETFTGGRGVCATLSLLAVIYLDCFYSKLQDEKCPLWYFKLLIVLLCACAGALTQYDLTKTWYKVLYKNIRIIYLQCIYRVVQNKRQNFKFGINYNQGYVATCHFMPENINMFIASI